MSDRSSRHFGLATYRRPVAGVTGEVELYEPRRAAEVVHDRVHGVQRGDRLDLLAWRYLGDSRLDWLLADANPAETPDAVLEAGRSLRVPERER